MPINLFIVGCVCVCAFFKYAFEMKVDKDLIYIKSIIIIECQENHLTGHTHYALMYLSDTTKNMLKAYTFGLHVTKCICSIH